MRNPMISRCVSTAEKQTETQGWEHLRRGTDRLRRREEARRRKRIAAVSAVAGAVAAIGVFSAAWAGIMYALMREWSKGEDPASEMIRFIVFAVVVAMAGLVVKVVIHYVESRLTDSHRYKPRQKNKITQ